MDITWLTDRIAVGGGIWNPENMAKVAAAGITHIIDMQIEFDDTPLARPFGIEVLWNPTDDDFEPKAVTLFRRGVRFAREALDDGEGKLFVHCAAGVHRAPMMALALLGTMGWKADDAMELIAAMPAAAELPEPSGEQAFGDVLRQADEPEGHVSRCRQVGPGDEAAVVDRLCAFRDAGATDLAVRVLALGPDRESRIESRKRTLAFLASLCPEL